MSRDIEQYNVQSSQDDQVNRVTLAKCTFENGTVRVHDGLGVIHLENLVEDSEDAAGDFWTQLGIITVSQDSVVAPDGATTADKLVEATSTGQHRIGVTINTTANAAVTSTVFVKRSTGSRNLFMQIYNATDGTIGSVYVDPDDGSIVANAAGIGVVKDVGGGWYRVSISATPTVSGTFFGYQLANVSTVSYTGDGSSDLAIWGMSVSETGSYSGYFPTTTAPKYAEEFIGVGSIGTVSSVRVTPDLRPIPVTLNLSGVPNSVLYEAITGNHYGLDVKLYSCFTDNDGKPLTEPTLDWQGYLDSISVEVGESSGSMTVTAESRLSFWDKANLRRYTDVDQQAEYAGDKFFEYLPQMFELELQWGGQKVSTGTAPNDATRPQSPSGADYDPR